MSSLETSQPAVHASLKEAAVRIAASHGETPKTISVQMVASEAIEQFLADIQHARVANFSVKLAVD